MISRPAFINRAHPEGTMFAKTLTDGRHTRHFSIEEIGYDGWEVRQVEDSRLITRKRYTDWHRVERALALFALEVEALERQGWQAADG